MKLLILTAVLCAAQAPAEVPKPDPRESLATLIPYSIRLLEQKKYKEFIEQLSDPADLKKVLQTRTMEDLVKTFSKEKVETSHAVLKQIKDAMPKLLEDASVAEYEVKVPNFAKNRIRFVKVGKTWRIQN